MAVTRNSLYKFRREFADTLMEKYESDMAEIAERYPELASKLSIKDEDAELLKLEENAVICDRLNVSDKTVKSVVALYKLLDVKMYEDDTYAKALKTAINAFLFDYAEKALGDKFEGYTAHIEKRIEESKTPSEE